MPTIEAHQVLIKVDFCGICGSDVHSYEGMQVNIHSRRTGPRVIGHEVVGHVAAVGAAVRNCQPGDRVVCIPWAPCGQCYYCRRGMVNHCQQKEQLGGALAEYCVSPASAVHQVPAGLSLERAALAEPMSCCVWAIDLAGITSGSTVAIIGAGTMGLLLLELAKASGAAHAIVSEPHASRRAVAAQLGADLIVDPRATDLAEAVLAFTNGIGCDTVLEVVGHPATVNQALTIARRAGTIVIVGVADPNARLEISPFDIYLRELTIKGCFTRRLSFDRGLAWLAKLNLDPIITHTFSLSQVTEAMECSRTGLGTKVLVRPD